MTKLEKAERLALHYAEQITELENQIADIKANCDLAIEGRDIKIKELEADNRLLEQRGSDILKDLLDKNKRYKEIERQIEKMKCCGNCSKYDRNNRVCSRTKFSVIETLCNCSDDWELKE